MNAYATKLAEAFSAKLLGQVYARSIFPAITNSDYAGDVQQGTKVHIPSLARVKEKTYDGSNLTADDLNEMIATLTVDEFKSFYFKVKSIDVYKSFIKDPASKTINQRASERKKNVDGFVLNFHGDVASGNRVGADHTAGTVAINSGGTVTGVGTGFTAGMVGKGFKAAGHTKWYRVKTFTSATVIVIEDDLDDVASAYTGGVIGSGASYVIEASAPVAVTKANILGKLLDLKTKLDDAEVPEEDRFLVVPSVIENIITLSTDISLSVPAHYEMLLKRGYLGEVAGFQLYKTTRLAGNNTAGYHCVGGTTDWLTFADKVIKTGIEEDLIGNFGSAYKDLYVYGAKVADERRKFGVELFAKV